MIGGTGYHRWRDHGFRSVATPRVDPAVQPYRKAALADALRQAHSLAAKGEGAATVRFRNIRSVNSNPSLRTAWYVTGASAPQPSPSILLCTVRDGVTHWEKGYTPEQFEQSDAER